MLQQRGAIHFVQWNSREPLFKHAPFEYHFHQPEQALELAQFKQKQNISMLCFISGKVDEYRFEVLDNDRFISLYFLNDEEFCTVSYGTKQYTVLQSIYRINTEKKRFELVDRVNYVVVDMAFKKSTQSSFFTQPQPFVYESNNYFLFDCGANLAMLPWDAREMRIINGEIRKICINVQDTHIVANSSPIISGSKLYYFNVQGETRIDRNGEKRKRIDMNSFICYDLSKIKTDSQFIWIENDCPCQSIVQFNSEPKFTIHRPLKYIQQGSYVVANDYTSLWPKTRKGSLGKSRLFVINLLTQEVHETWVRIKCDDILAIIDGFLIIWNKSKTDKTTRQKTLYQHLSLPNKKIPTLKELCKNLLMFGLSVDNSMMLKHTW